MYSSRARGGPLDGVKICAPLSWEGMLHKDFAPRNSQDKKHFHPGRYVWVAAVGWVWHSGVFVKIPGIRPDAVRTWRLQIQ